MKIVFVTNFINHHQVHIADEFYELTGHNYSFVATTRMPDSFAKSGYPDFSDRPYLVNAYESSETEARAIAMIDDADVVMCGSAPERFVRNRIRSGKLTFRYSERWFKGRRWWQTGPRGWYNLLCNHYRYTNKPLYMLAASAYTANDVNGIGLYRDKVYKWGYFTKVDGADKKNLETLSGVSSKGSARTLWCARFLCWKHPELPVKLAKMLKNEGYPFELNMYGSGEELERTKRLAERLGVTDIVSFCGNIPNEQMLEQMRRHDIFLFTSDRNEGWGAVLNEAMSNGCAVVASDKIGAVPFLVKDGENGLIFKSEDLQSLYTAVKRLLDDEALREKLSRNAVETMQTLWNPRHAARSFITLVTSLLEGHECPITEGPCSKAYPVK